MYQFIKPFLDKKCLFFEEYGTFNFYLCILEWHFVNMFYDIIFAMEDMMQIHAFVTKPIHAIDIKTIPQSQKKLMLLIYRSAHLHITVSSFKSVNSTKCSKIIASHTTVLSTSLGKTVFAWPFILNENILFWLTISYQKPFVFSVSVVCSQILTLKLNLRPNIGLTYAISIVKWYFEIFVLENIFLCWIWILDVSQQYFENFRAQLFKANDIVS